MRGAPHSGFSRLSRRISSRTCGWRIHKIMRQWSLVQPSTVPSPLAGSKIYWGYNASLLRTCNAQSPRSFKLLILLREEDLTTDSTS
jgi:hypothetical protein